MKLLLMFLGCLCVPGALVSTAAPLPPGTPVRGWTILTDSEPDAMATIAAAPAYDINHLQLSHLIVHDLREVKDDEKCAVVNRLTDAAHKAGITEVVLWDHALYPLNYYPKKFRTGRGGTIDLDNPEFWEWLKADYRAMLDRVPNADGIVLTFIETGARAERQHSAKLKTDQEKIAAVVNAVADVVIGERKLNLYARTFSYTHAEYANIIGAVNLFARQDIRLMMKETPHDFFLTHPSDRYAGTIARPTLMEFDTTGEFHGQNIVAVTWPEYILRRWQDFAKRPHIIGYTARTDRYGDTRLVDTPGETNLLALKRGTEDPKVTADQVYDEFITQHYGVKAVPEVKAAFKNAFDISSSTFYTLGVNVANHSALNFDSVTGSFVLHVTGKWVEPPIGHVGHGVDRDFHYWRDSINHIAPPYFKSPKFPEWNEVSWVLTNGWINAAEAMDEEYLRYIVTEKNFGVARAGDSVRHIENARPALKSTDYEQLHRYFQRTLLTARIRRAVASAYYGFRLWCRGEGYRTPYVRETVQIGLAEIKDVAALIRSYPVKPPTGQWDWKKDAGDAEQYFNWIVRDGWPKETLKAANPNAGMKFPFREKEPTGPSGSTTETIAARSQTVRNASIRSGTMPNHTIEEEHNALQSYGLAQRQCTSPISLPLGSRRSDPARPRPDAHSESGTGMCG